MANKYTDEEWRVAVAAALRETNGTCFGCNESNPDRPGIVQVYPESFMCPKHSQGRYDHESYEHAYPAATALYRMLYGDER